MTETTVTIDRLGALGDGVAETQSGRLHVPFSAPGDRVRVKSTGKDAAEIVELLEPGAHRTAPACRHFGTCGGCALQHLDARFIADWKRSRVVETLARAGLGAALVDPTVVIPPGTRRRATLAARRLGGRVLLGFAERASHRLVDLAECPLLRPDLAGLVAPIRAKMKDLLTPHETADIALTGTDTGVDFVLVRRRDLTLADREALAALAESCDLARVSWRPSLTAAAEPVAERRRPLHVIGPESVPFSQGAFLQPSSEGEAALAALVMDAVGASAGPVVDLFSGLGTFAVPALGRGPVSAFDNDAAAIATLAKAMRGKPLTAAPRDLFREPLTAAELDGFAAAILDPPRAGAQAQSRTLADCAVPVLAYVSCNPVSFARDAAILTGGGYRLERAVPVDQFAWSPHIELVGVFRR